MKLNRWIVLEVVLLGVLIVEGCRQTGPEWDAAGLGRGDRDKRKRVFTPPPDLDILQVTQAPPPADPPRTPPFDDAITAATVSGPVVTVRFHADDRLLTPESYAQSEPLIIRSMLGLAREFGTNGAGRYRPLEINGVQRHPFRPGSYHSGSGTAVVLTLASPRSDPASTNNEGNLEEVAIYDRPWATLQDSTPGQTWTAYGYLVLHRIKEVNGQPQHRRLKCYFLREDSNGVERPMTEARLAPRLMSALSSGYVRFASAERGSDSAEEEVKIFTGGTNWP